MALNKVILEAWHYHNGVQRRTGAVPDPRHVASLMAEWADDPADAAPLVAALVEALAWACTRDRTLQLAPRVVATINTDKE